MIFVTSYRNPDIDGIACCIGYSDLSKKRGKATSATYIGNLSLEVEFVRRFTKFFPVEKHSGKYPENSAFVLVDTADPDAIEPTIPLSKVVEIFDHRELVFVDKFVNAKKKIEKVGSCATLITELFQKNKIKPSRNSAIYLYSAIISNTINFKNSVTTQRDVVAVKWLKPITGLGEDYIKKMFTYKSKVSGKEKLIFLMEQDFSTKELHSKKIGIVQIEVVALEEIIANHKNAIKEELVKLKKQGSLDYILFTGIDIVEGFNILIVIDEDSDSFFTRALGIPTFGEVYKTNYIIMRKQIWPKVDEFLKRMI